MMTKSELKHNVMTICEYAISKGKDTDWDNVMECFYKLQNYCDTVDGFESLGENEFVGYVEELIHAIMRSEALGMGDDVIDNMLRLVTNIYNVVIEWDKVADRIELMNEGDYPTPNLNEIIGADDSVFQCALYSLAEEIVDRAKGKAGDFFIDVTNNMWEYDREIDRTELYYDIIDVLDKITKRVEKIDIVDSEDKSCRCRVWFTIKNGGTDTTTMFTDPVQGFNHWLTSKVHDDYKTQCEYMRENKIREVIYDEEYDILDLWVVYCVDVIMEFKKHESAVRYYNENKDRFISAEQIEGLISLFEGIFYDGEQRYLRYYSKDAISEGEYCKYRYRRILVDEPIEGDDVVTMKWPHFQMYVDPMFESDRELSEEDLKMNWDKKSDTLRFRQSYKDAFDEWEGLRINMAIDL